MAICYLSLGSNIGEREKNLKKAISFLKKKGIKILEKSKVLETKPVGYKNQPDFLNQVIKVETNLSPFELLKTVKIIEREIGRKKTFRWGPRIIDIDILIYDDVKINTKRLTIPHREIKNRDFIITLLKELKAYEN
jgi:2-amino-4-hydroxy-6-hydroxymethyldihydropteridine diphosphokinase